MCLAKAFLGESEAGQFIMEDVATLRIEGTRVYLRDLFGEQKDLDALVKVIDFQNGKVILESLSQGSEK